MTLVVLEPKAELTCTRQPPFLLTERNAVVPAKVQTLPAIAGWFGPVMVDGTLYWSLPAGQVKPGSATTALAVATGSRPRPATAVATATTLDRTVLFTATPRA